MANSPSSLMKQLRWAIMFSYYSLAAKPRSWYFSIIQSWPWNRKIVLELSAYSETRERERSYKTFGCHEPLKAFRLTVVCCNILMRKRIICSGKYIKTNYTNRFDRTNDLQVTITSQTPCFEKNCVFIFCTLFVLNK